MPVVIQTATSSQPILLIYDGHSSHKTPETIKWAREQGILLFVLPAHSSRLLQPLDVAILDRSRSSTTVSVPSICLTTWEEQSLSMTSVNLHAGRF